MGRAAWVWVRMGWTGLGWDEGGLGLGWEGRRELGWTGEFG